MSDPVMKWTAGFYISKRDNLHSIDSETESEEEIYAYEGKKRKRQSVEEEVQTSFKKV